MAEILIANSDNIQIAANSLKNGELVSFPTETVYGLGANATDDDAVKRIFEAKKRPDFNPLIVHVSDWDMVEKYAQTNNRAKALAKHFWPGPLSIILPRKQNSELSTYVSGGLDTVALRQPEHIVAKSLLKCFGLPIAAPSANLSGSLSPTTPYHVQQSLDDKVDIILAGGKCSIGLESTIIDMTGDKAVVLRAGFILPETIADLLNEDVEIAYENVEVDKPHSPGQLLRHYAPNTPLRLKAVDITKDEILLAFGSTKFMSAEGKGGVPEERILNLSPSGDLLEAASNLFSMLHELDSKGYSRIAVMDIPKIGIGIAINDRLSRASNAQKEIGD